jgi:hypothetical protein
LLESPALLEPQLNVREIAGEGGPIGLDTGFHLVTVDANLPPRRVGAAAIGIELTVPAAPPDRPQTINRTLRFDTAAALTSVPLRLGPNEAPGFDYRTFVIAAIGGSADRLEGEVRHNDDDHLTIPQDAFAVDFVRAEATSALLSLGKVAIAWGGTRLGGTWRADVELTMAMPAVAVARPRDCENCVIRAQFIATDGSRTLEIPASPAGDLWLDLSNLVEFGPQSAELTIIFDETRIPVAIEYAGEDATGDEAAITMVRIRPEEPKVDISWLPASPFRNGFRLRWVRPDGGRGDWSPIFSAGTAQILEASRAATSEWSGSAGAPARDDSVDTTGLTLIATEPGSYVYRAASPRLAKNPDGRPALQFTAAGTAGFVQITAEFDVGPERLALLAEALKKRDGADPKLSPAADTISETQLLLEGKVVATGTASGIPPQTSLLSAMLDAAQAVTIQKVMAGTRGLAVVRYTVEASDPVSDTSGFDQTTGDTAGSAAISSRSHSRQFHRHVIQAEADLADLITG